MKITLAQINPIVGDFDGNKQKIISIIKKSKSDLVVFPELCITGYSPQDLLSNPNFIKKNLEALNEIAKAVKNKCAVVGFVDSAGDEIFNSAAVIQNQKIIAVHHKMFLPNYNIFDEKRWFAKGDEPTVFFLKGKKIGINICEDIWFEETSRKQKEKGAELIINISASPYRKGKLEKIENVIRQRYNENKIPIIFVNQVGAQDGIVYYGHSMFFDKNKIIKKLKDFEEDIILIEL